MNKDYEDLEGYRKIQAYRACIKLFHDFSEEEAKAMAPSIHEVWWTGRQMVQDLAEEEILRD